MRSLKLVTLGFAIVVLTTLAAQAQTWSDSLTKEERFWSRSGGYARELALGAGGFGMLADSGINTIAVNPYSVDPLFMLQNPAYASHYSSYLWMDAGLGSSPRIGQNFGSTFAFSDNFTGGLILSRLDAVGYTLLNPNLFPRFTQLAETFSFSPTDNTWEILGSIKAGSANIGLGVSYASSSSSVNGIGLDSSTASYHQIGISAGLLMHGDDGMLLDVDVNALMPSLTLSGSGNTGELSVTSLGFNARAMIPVKSEFFIVPIANFYYASGSSTIVATPKDLPTSSNIDVGVGANFWQSGLHFMGGLSFGYYKNSTPAIMNNTPEVSHSQTIFPRWNFGAEWPILKWLDVRLGYFASSGSETVESPASATTTSSMSRGQANLYSPIFDEVFSNQPPSGVTAGASAHIGRFSADAMLTLDALHSATLNVLNQTFGFVTFSYHFE
jgi:hypothetical protein